MDAATRAKLLELDRMHVALQRWIASTYPGVEAIDVASILSYEMARIVASLDDEIGAIDVDTLIEGILETMKNQIAAHRAGRLAP